mgnify:CR=1 FL=1
MPQLAAARQCTNAVRRAKAVYATALNDSTDCREGAECEEAEYSAEPDGPHFTYFPQTEARHRSVIAMKNLPWRPYLHGKEQRHKEDILVAYRKELRFFDPMGPKGGTDQKLAVLLGGKHGFGPSQVY